MVRRKLAHARRKSVKPLRVAVCIDTRDQWGRDRLFGFLQYAQTRNWQIHRLQNNNKSALGEGAPPSFDGAIFYDCLDEQFQALLRERKTVCVELGLRNQHLMNASVSLNDSRVVRMQAEHLRAVGFGHLGLCGYAQNHVSDIRESYFLEQTKGAGHVFRDSLLDGVVDIAPLTRWLKSLPKPVGVLTCDDRGGERVLAACRWAGLRVPDEVGVIGLGNDELVCEMTQPRLSSVVIPTQKIGWLGAQMLERLMTGKTVKELNLSLSPLDVVCRTSTDKLLAARPVVLKAIKFIREEGCHPIGVEQVVEAVGVSRSTLERAFSADTGKTVHEYFVQLRMELAKQLLRKTNMTLNDVSAQSGYLSLSAFAQMFASYAGMSPREYRDKHQQPSMRIFPKCD